MADNQNMNGTQIFLSLALCAGGVWYFFGGGLEKQANKDMQNIENKVATDAVAQYQIAKRNGSPTDVCVAANMVTAAYLQAKDETNYATWKAAQKADCAAAGMPGM